MTKQPSSPKPSTADQILDLLLDALLERQAIRETQPERSGPVQPSGIPSSRTQSSAPPTSQPGSSLTRLPPAEQAEKPATGHQPPEASPKRPSQPQRRKPRPGEKGWTPPPRLAGINLARTLGRLLLVLVALVVLLNVPVNRYGTSLARILPDSAALVIRDGLVLKGSGPDIYVLEDNKLRWISSLEAFEFFDYRWEQVHIVDDSFLRDFEKGKPIHVLLKCQGSPHIYALENGKKRWIKDIPTFESEGYVWEDVKQVSCAYLQDLPDGPPIPEDAGPPPQP
jgi:hypothetical protein